jgi:integrase
MWMPTWLTAAHTAGVASRNNVAYGLKAFFRHCTQRQWTRAHLADGIQGPRIYALEGLPAGPDWSDVRRLLASLDAKNPTDVRDRPILMLFAIYGLRASEVARLRLEHLDWEHDRLNIPRAKRRETQVYPLLPSVGHALIRYLQKVRRRPSVHREVFLTLRPPFQPISTAGLYNVAAHRLKALGLRTAHYGPHSLCHACAARLVAGLKAALTTPVVKPRAAISDPRKFGALLRAIEWL